MIPLALACLEAPHQSQAEAFQDALSLASSDKRGALAACSALVGETPRGDCALSVLEIAGGATRNECAELPAGPWRDECLFLAAERMNPIGDYSVAQATCVEAGSVATKCANHVWRARIRLETGDLPNASHAAVLVDSEARLRADVPDSPWSQLPAGTESWSYTLKHYFRRVRAIDPTICAALPTEAQATCLPTASSILIERLGRTIEKDPAAYERFLCRAPARYDGSLPWDGPEATSGWLTWTGSDELRPTLEQAAAQFCPG